MKKGEYANNVKKMQRNLPITAIVITLSIFLYWQNKDNMTSGTGPHLEQQW